MLPPGVTVFERGWLSSNNILFVGNDDTALVDSGYVTHCEQTVALVRAQLHDRPLDLLLNTHLHSDHCGGNARLQLEYPSLRTLIPPGDASNIAKWDEDALTYRATGQLCPRFSFSEVLKPGSSLLLASREWQIHAAPGHDPHSVVFFEPSSRCLISADALWETGFGVVFPELEGERGFQDVALTLDLIESLDPLVVIPGHGSIFTNVNSALAIARRRLEQFIGDQNRHTSHALKVLLKFKLLQAHSISTAELMDWAVRTDYLSIIYRREGKSESFDVWIRSVLASLEKSAAARVVGDQVFNA